MNTLLDVVIPLTFAGALTNAWVYTRYLEAERIFEDNLPYPFMKIVTILMGQLLLFMGMLHLPDGFTPTHILGATCFLVGLLSIHLITPNSSKPQSSPIRWAIGSFTAVIITVVLSLLFKSTF